MRTASASSRGLSPIVAITFVVVALLLGTGLTIGSLWALGVDLPFFARKAPPAPPTGFPVPVLAQPLPAYTKIKLEHFFDPKTKEPKFRYLKSEQEADELGFIKHNRDLINRVLTRDKPADFPFVERDLNPKGTRDGVVAGIPLSKRAFVLPADKVQGIHNLKAGDHFDLLASMPIDMDKALAKFKTAGAPDPSLALAGGKHANVRVVVQNGAVVLAVGIREIPTGSPVGGKTPSKPVQEATIAVDPEEVALLHEALAIHATLVCVARSGLPDETKAKSVTPGSPPAPQMHTMEVITSGKRQTLVFTGPGKGPREEPSFEAKSPGQ